MQVKKIHFFLLFLLFLSFNMISQHNFNNLIGLDTIGVSPVELPRYADKHNIKRMLKVRLSNKEDTIFYGDGRDINIGRQKGTIDDIKEYDWHGSITLDVEYKGLGPLDIRYEYTYNRKKDLIIGSADLSGWHQTGVRKYHYNEQTQLDSIQILNLYLYERDSIFDYKGATFFDYDDLGRLEQITFLYENFRTNLIDTVGRTIYKYNEDTCKITKYQDYSASFDFYTLIYNKKGQIIEQQNEYQTEKYEYNAAGWLSKKTDYNKKGERTGTIDYFYDENYLLIGSEQYLNSKYKTEILYIYEFY